ncbi:hypothetical protein ABMA28_011760 [Loxostege sticticalis]|uniref:CCHC-type domain-containing protein n=1 Tax=Loxostege sticticalis TaxID=481309 RepID=A0ABD0TKI5_LOXSC
MSKEVNPSYLNKEELIYEVKIREEVPDSTVDALRKQLRSLLSEYPSDQIVKTDLDPNDELEVIKQKLKELQELVVKQKQSPSSTSLIRLKTLAYHLHHRLNRVEVEEVSIKQKVSFCQGSLNILFELLEQQIPGNPQEDEISEQLAVDCKQINNIQVFDHHQSEKPSGSGCSRAGNKSIAKWNVRFNGVSDPRSFLDRVEDLQIADGVSDQELLDSAARLFVDQALIWFRAVRSDLTSWKELRALLLEDFSIVDYDFKLLGEIRLRTQGIEEPLHIYFSIMKCMFGRLKKPLPETEKLEILLRNIRPFYSQQLAFVEITSVDELLKKCKVIEVMRQRGLDFSEPDKQNFSVFTSDFLYKPKKQAQSSFSSSKQTGNPESVWRNTKQNSVNLVSAVSKEKQLGRKCGKPDHNFKTCRNNRNCFICGKPGHFAKLCQNKNVNKPPQITKN